MATFSQRIGIKPLEKAMQTESMDDDLRAALWNVLCIVWDIWVPKGGRSGYSRNRDAELVDEMAGMIWARLLKLPLDVKPAFKSTSPYEETLLSRLRIIVLQGQWHEVYDLIDFIVRNMDPRWETLIGALNRVLEAENAAYRFVARELVPITTPEEIAAIENAISTTSKATKAHLESALNKLADRKSPDYRNSIKESISAVEAACQAIAGKPKATLGQCLAAIQQKKPLHGAFVEALNRLYGYTSDAEHGIRHAMADEAKEVTKADAQFMLVSCSAFINYLWSVAAETGLKVE